MDAVAFRNIKKRLGDFELNIPELIIRKGYITGFIGENGAGKTTTIKLIMGMLIADEGEIEVEGLSIKEHAKEIKEQIGYVGEPTGYPEENKLKDIKRMIAPFYKEWDESLFKKYSQDFGLKLNQKYGELSTGQKKQFALVMALAHRPKLIILDEPTSGLDPVIRGHILDLLMEHMQSEDVTVFYSTHITSDLERAGDYIVYINDGKVEMNREKDELLENYCIAKGPKHLFDKEVQKEAVGIKRTHLGCQALFLSKDIAYELLGEEVKYERATIEQIMLFLSHRGGVEHE